MADKAKKLLEVPARCLMNEVNNLGEGGRILLHAVDKLAAEAGHRQAEMILNAANDAAMEAYPADKKGMSRRRFRIVVYDEGEFSADEMVELGLGN